MIASHLGFPRSSPFLSNNSHSAWTSCNKYYYEHMYNVVEVELLQAWNLFI